MVWANFHDRDFLVKAIVLAAVSSTRLILSNFSITTSWNLIWLQSHELRLLHVWVALTTVLLTECLSLSIWVPVVVGLVVPMVLVERIIEVTIDPGKLRNVTEIEWSLGLFIWSVFVVRTEWVDSLVEVGVDNLVSEIGRAHV